LNDGAVNGRQVLHPAVVRQLSTWQATIPDSHRGYGYGLYLCDEGMTLEHGGRCAGFGSFLRISKAHRLGVVVLGNRYGVLLKRAADAAFASAGVPVPPEVAVYYDEADGAEIRGTAALSLAGQYRSGHAALELYVHESTLRGRNCAGEFAIRQISPDRFVFSGDAFYHPLGAVRTVTAHHTYLHLEGRAFRLVA
ncbi:MAG: serine hydrolase, partial [Acidobacteria bacterium]|nr:serine hydrolase [Acidobacteriota bacterium]